MGVSRESMLQTFRQFAVEIAQKAGDLIMSYHKRRMHPVWTSATHFKTEADDRSDELFRDAVSRQFPGHSIMSEEGDLKETDSRYMWVYDGVDGTTNFWSGITDHFSVSVALLEDGVPIVGVINAAKRKELYSAVQGCGAFLNDTLISPADHKTIAKALVQVDGGKDDRSSHFLLAKRVIDAGAAYCFATPCASVPLCLVASGQLHAYLATNLAPEDVAAAILILKESGCRVTKLDGSEVGLGGSILAATPVLHNELLVLVNS